MPRTLAHMFVAIHALLFLLACSAGPRYAYHRVELNLPMVGGDSASVMAVDRREAVIRGQRQPSFVGTHRSDAHHSKLVQTASGNDFSEDLTAVVSRALKRSGYRVTTLDSAPGRPHDQAFQDLRQTESEHLLLIEVSQWQTNTFKNTQLVYRLELSVFNSAGALKGKSSVAGSDQLAASHTDPAGLAEDVVRRALDHKLTLLFSEPKIIQAFKRQH